MAEQVVRVLGVDHSLEYLPQALKKIAGHIKPGQTIGLELTPEEVKTGVLVYRLPEHQPFWLGILAYCKSKGIHVLGFDFPLERHEKLFLAAEKSFPLEAETGLRQRHYVRFLRRNHMDLMLPGDFHYRSLVERLKKVPGLMVEPVGVVGRWSRRDYRVPDSEEMAALRAERIRLRMKHARLRRSGFASGNARQPPKLSKRPLAKRLKPH